MVLFDGLNAVLNDFDVGIGGLVNWEGAVYVAPTPEQTNIINCTNSKLDRLVLNLQLKVVRIGLMVDVMSVLGGIAIMAPMPPTYGAPAEDALIELDVILDAYETRMGGFAGLLDSESDYINNLVTAAGRKMFKMIAETKTECDRLLEIISALADQAGV